VEQTRLVSLIPGLRQLQFVEHAKLHRPPPVAYSGGYPGTSVFIANGRSVIGKPRLCEFTEAG
jgi:hypothetical protein